MFFSNPSSYQFRYDTKRERIKEMTIEFHFLPSPLPIPINPQIQAIIAEFQKDMETLMNEQSDAVNHPSHYNSLPAVCSECGTLIECIDVVRHMGFNLGNAVKYAWRAGEKDPDTEIEDLRKAIWYIQDRIEQLEKEKFEQETK